jgi:hypothetical protein
VECDSAELASYLYSELQGAELERSANVLNLSFIPDDMTFDEVCRYALLFYLLTASSLSHNTLNRDQATSADKNTNYQPLDFATDVSLQAAKPPSA